MSAGFTHSCFRWPSAMLTYYLKEEGGLRPYALSLLLPRHAIEFEQLRIDAAIEQYGGLLWT